MSERVVIWINGRFLTQSLTGVQRYAWELVQALDKLVDSGEIDGDRYEIRLITPRKIQHEISLRKIRVYPSGFLRGHAWEQIELPFFTWGSPLVCLGNSAPIFPRGEGSRLIVTMHDLSFRYYPESYSKSYRLLHGFLSPRIFARADRLITVSNSEKRRLLKYYPEHDDKIFVIHHGSDHIQRIPALAQGRIAPEIKEIMEQGYILFIGSFNPLKNLKALLEAFPQVETEPPIHLVVIGGGGNVFTHMNVALPPSVQGRVHFLGQISDFGLLRALYEKARLLVFPSLSESFGLPCLEAMRLGCPVMASDIPALREVCADAAIFIDPQQVDDIVHKLRGFFSSPQEERFYREKGLRQAEEFTWENTARKTWEIIRKTL